ncbi:sodium/nucleoside cotransporter, partial [Metarhizium brunneum ARSEF 3297]
MSMSISTRRCIRWLPGEASEPTSTIVLTSPQRRFVDLRILKDGPGGLPCAQDTLPLSRLDWAIAGTSSSSSRTIDGKQVSHSRWDHWIDSRTSQPETASDQGDMYPQPDGSTLEKGRMVNPDTGRETAYEEIWDDEEPAPTASEQVCAVLKYEEGPTRGLVVRLGRYSQGFVRSGQEISLERWEWKRSQAVRTVRMGQEELPCKQALERTYRLGDQVSAGSKTWTVVEVA